jgi:hypothetical protein
VLAAVSLNSLNSDIAIYTVPAGKTRCSFSVSACNRSGGAIAVGLSLCANGQAPSGDGSNAIESNASVPAYSTLERAGLVLLTGQTLFARTNTLGTTSVVVYGIEE